MYHLYSKALKSHGFLINPYGRCIINSTIQYKQCTIAWYFGNNKVSHVDEEVNTKMIETTAKFFGNPTVSRGKKHNLLVMDIDFSDGRELSLFVKYYIEE